MVAWKGEDESKVGSRLIDGLKEGACSRQNNSSPQDFHLRRCYCAQQKGLSKCDSIKTLGYGDRTEILYRPHGPNLITWQGLKIREPFPAEFRVRG